jgi:tetratricopeptide (TPR) repeat protein
MADLDDESPSEPELWSALEGQIGVARAATLIDLAKITLEKDDGLASALVLAETALDTARETEDEQIIAKALATRSMVLHGQEDYAACAVDAEASASLFERYGSLEFAMQGYFLAATSKAHLQEIEEAIALDRKAVALAVEIEDDFYIGQISLHLARGLRELDAPLEEVLAPLADARAAFRRGGDAKDVMAIDEERAHLLNEWEEHQLAEAIFRDLAALARSMEYPRYPFYLAFLAYTLRCLDRNEEAIAILDEVQAKHVERDNVGPMGTALRSRALSLWELKRYDEAWEALTLARIHCDFAGYEDSVLSCDFVKARWLQREGRFAEALEFNRSIAENGDDLDRFATRERMAENHFALGETVQALHLLDTAEIAPKWIGLATPWFNAQCLRARIFRASDRLEEAQQIAEAALTSSGVRNASRDTRQTLMEIVGPPQWPLE